MGSDSKPDWLVTCRECGVVRDRSRGRSPCPVCDTGSTTPLATDGGEDTFETASTEAVATPDCVSIVAFHEGEAYAKRGDYGFPPTDDVDEFRRRVAELVGTYFERDDGTVVELVGDFNGHAVYREADAVKAQEDAATYARVFMVEWSRFEDEFDVMGDPKSTADALRGE